MNPFANWKLHDVALHNERIKIRNSRDEVVAVATVKSPKREADLHAQIFSECRRRGWIAFHGSMSERTHRTCGEPDFVILADSGRLLMVECKMPNGKLSIEQQAMVAHASKLGHTIHVVRSMEEFFKVSEDNLNEPESTTQWTSSTKPDAT